MAVIVADTVLPTAVVVMVKLAEVNPAKMVRLDCTGAFVLFEDNVMPTPPTAAGPLSVTVPTVLFPPTSELGVRVMLDRAGGFTVKVANWVELPSAATMFAVFVLWSGMEVTVNVADVEPAEIVTDAGTVAMAVFELVSRIVSPEGPAGPFSVTVPVDVDPPTTDVGLRLTELTLGVVTVSTVDALTLPEVAVMVTNVLVETAVVVIAKVVDVCPAGTITVVGTTVDGSLLVRLTTSPPTGAAFDKVTVPLDPDPPTTVVGWMATVLTASDHVGTGNAVTRSPNASAT